MVEVNDGRARSTQSRMSIVFDATTEEGSETVAGEAFTIVSCAYDLKSSMIENFFDEYPHLKPDFVWTPEGAFSSVALRELRSVTRPSSLVPASELAAFGNTYHDLIEGGYSCFVLVKGTAQSSRRVISHELFARLSVAPTGGLLITSVQALALDDTTYTHDLSDSPSMKAFAQVAVELSPLARAELFLNAIAERILRKPREFFPQALSYLSNNHA